MLKIDIQSKIISKKASRGFLKPKYKTLHTIFRKKLIPKTKATFNFPFFFEEIQAKYNENAISKKRIFQAIGKTQPGGVIAGLIELYQSLFTALVVNILPTAATR